MPDITIKISVLIPVYNSAEYLRKCLDSVEGQSYSNWEAFVIDDASTDDSFQLLSQYAAEDSRIRIYRHDVNKGPGITRNEAIEYASKRLNQSKCNAETGYIVFLDSDDWIEKNYFQAIVDVAIKENADVIFVDVVQEDVAGKYIKYERMSAYKSQSKDTVIRHQMTGKLPWGGCRKAVRIDLIIENNIKYSSDTIGEEAIYSFKLLYNAERLAFIEETLYHYIIHSNSQSGKHDDDPWGDVCGNMKSYLSEVNLFKQYESTLNSFALTAFIVMLFKVTSYYGIKKAYKIGCQSLRNYHGQFRRPLDVDSLEWRVRCVYPFIKFSMILPVIMLAKVKDALNG